MIRIVLYSRRTTYVRTGGRKINFTVFTLLRNNNYVGIGIGKSSLMSKAISYSFKKASNNSKYFNPNHITISTILSATIGSTTITLIPCNINIGILAGSYIRTILQSLNIVNIYCIINGTRNKVNIIKATCQALNLLD